MEEPRPEDLDQTHTSAQPLNKETIGEDASETTHDLLDNLPSLNQGDGQPVERTLGRYVLLEEIGAGGMGRVFKAKQKILNRLVALKVLPPGRMKDQDQIKRFFQEVEAAGQLQHENIVRAYDAGEENEVLYLVMEYVEGDVLSKVVKRDGPVDLEKAISYFLQTAKGLEYAHSRELVHRDIKPSNLILDPEGTVKILDMGTARFGEEEKSEDNLTQTGVIMGTVNYMSPEQARDARHVDYRTDIYSLGCTFYYLLTGKTLYQGDMIQTLLAHAQKPIPNVQEFDREIPDWVDEVLKRMLAKKPEDRFQSLTELIQNVQSHLRREESDEDDESREEKRLIDPGKFDEIFASSGETVAHNIVGIDLGTASSAIAYVNAVGKPIIVTDSDDRGQIPSAVLIDGISTLVGFPAMAKDEERFKDLALEIKRFVGKQFYPEKLHGESYRPEVLLALVLSQLLSNAQRQIGECKQVVIAVPAHFDELARKAVQDAGYIAGVEVTDIINEPMAAALYYGYQQQRGEQNPEDGMADEKIVVVDLGAGKLDVMALERAGNEWKAVSSTGDTKLGGRDWDICLEEVIAEAFESQHGADPRSREEDVIRLWKTAEIAKHRLTRRNDVKIRFQGGRQIVQETITRDQFEERSAGLLERVRHCLLGALQTAQWSAQDIDQVILVGAATQMPMIQKLVRQTIDSKTKVSMLEPSSVALGAALHASYNKVLLSEGEPGQVYHNVSSHSLGIVGTDTKTGRKINAVVIPRNTPLPVTAKRTFKTHKEGQDKIKVEILEGESHSPEQCQLVGQCLIENLPSDLPARSPVTVEFHYSSNGRLTVHIEFAGSRETKELTRPEALTPDDLNELRKNIEVMVLSSNMV